MDQTNDAVLQVELLEDLSHIPSHKQRTALLLSSMQHLAQEIERAGWRGAYLRLDDPDNDGSLRAQLKRVCGRVRPTGLVVFRPEDFRTLRALQEAAESLGLRGR